MNQFKSYLGVLHFIVGSSYVSGLQIFRHFQQCFVMGFSRNYGSRLGCLYSAQQKIKRKIKISIVPTHRKYFYVNNH